METEQREGLRHVRRLVVELRPTYRHPGGSRRYLTAQAAFAAWAKAIIFAHCECSPMDSRDGHGPCDLHERLFFVEEELCPFSRGDGREQDNARYLRVKARLARWLRWRATL